MLRTHKAENVQFSTVCFQLCVYEERRHDYMCSDHCVWNSQELRGDENMKILRGLVEEINALPEEQRMMARMMKIPAAVQGPFCWNTWPLYNILLEHFIPLQRPAGISDTFAMSCWNVWDLNNVLLGRTPKKAFKATESRNLRRTDILICTLGL